MWTFLIKFLFSFCAHLRGGDANCNDHTMYKLSIHSIVPGKYVIFKVLADAIKVLLLYRIHYLFISCFLFGTYV